MAGKQSEAMSKAERAVKAGKMTASEAGRKYGVTVNSIYRARWYKEWRAASKGEEK